MQGWLTAQVSSPRNLDGNQHGGSWPTLCYISTGRRSKATLNAAKRARNIARGPGPQHR